MRIVIDYRPALRSRTGVGEYIHQVACALVHAGGDDVTLFSSSWKDRPPADVQASMPAATLVDRQLPVQLLNLAWHRFGWPPVEALANAEYDVAHSPHPLLMPTRSAAQVVTIHDLHFLAHPERTVREVRRDYPALARTHAQRADRIIVSSRFAASEVVQSLGVPAEKIAVCPAGAPAWKTPPVQPGRGDYMLFMGTLDARKNVKGLLEAYGRLLTRSAAAPRLVLAGGAGSEATALLAAIQTAPLAGHAEYLGYVPQEKREALLKGAMLLVIPSFEEGFGLTALEAMSAGVPVVASARGSLPEVTDGAALLIDPDDPESLATALMQLVSDSALRVTLSDRGLARAAQFTWAQAARDVRRAYEEALAHRHGLTGVASKVPRAHRY